MADQLELGVEADGCWWCGKPVERLCDTLLRREHVYEVDGVEHRRLLLYSVTDGNTCDARLCATCGESTPVRVCMTPRSKSTVESLDRCPYCSEHPDSGRDHADHEHRRLCREDADAARAKVTRIRR